MDKNEIITELNRIFIDILENENIQLTESTNANDIEEWDSLTHIQLVVAIEKYFKVKFTTQEIQQWKNVGEICASINNRLKP